MWYSTRNKVKNFIIYNKCPPPESILASFPAVFPMSSNSIDDAKKYISTKLGVDLSNESHVQQLQTFLESHKNVQIYFQKNNLNKWEVKEGTPPVSTTQSEKIEDRNVLLEILQNLDLSPLEKNAEQNQKSKRWVGGWPPGFFLDAIHEMQDPRNSVTKRKLGVALGVAYLSLTVGTLGLLVLVDFGLYIMDDDGIVLTSNPYRGGSQLLRLHAKYCAR